MKIVRLLQPMRFCILKNLIAESHIDLVIRISDFNLARDPLGLLSELSEFFHPTWFIRGYVKLEINMCREFKMVKHPIFNGGLDFPSLGG
jgi:hypothetical protein